MSNTQLHIFNTLYEQNISLESGKGLSAVTLPSRSFAEVDFTVYQWDQKFLSSLHIYMLKGALELTYQGSSITSEQIKKVMDVGLVALSNSKSFEIEFQNLSDGPGSFEGHKGHFVVVNKEGTKLEYLSVEQAFIQIPLKAYSSLLTTLKRDTMPFKDRVTDLSKQVQNQKQQISLLMQQRSVLKSWVVIGWVVAVGAALLSIWSIL